MDEKDRRILEILQKNCKLTTKELARMLNMPQTTVFVRIKKLEREGIIKSYRAILDAKKVGKPVTAFVLVSFSYRIPEEKKILSQRQIAKKISLFPEVQEVHIIAGQWDMIVKVKAKSVEEVGKFVVERLRKIEGIEKTLTCIVFFTEKEDTAISLYA